MNKSPPAKQQEASKVNCYKSNSPDQLARSVSVDVNRQSKVDLCPSVAIQNSYLQETLGIFEEQPNSHMQDLMNPATDITVKENQHLFLSMNAELSRLVSRQDEFITELHDRMPKDILLVHNIPFNFKIRLVDKDAPLKIIV